LGRIYGVQARDWTAYDGTTVDQLKNSIDKLSKGIDDRRLIVTHWNPGEVHLMALPPCHMFYQFGIRDGHLDIMMYQRSCDVPLGVPMNIASYALLLLLVARITGLKPGVFNHMLWNIHIYEDQMPDVHQQLERKPYAPPEIWINPEIKSLEDLETWVTPDDFKLLNYERHGKIQYAFSE
jgi:thymidylate synthase